MQLTLRRVVNWANESHIEGVKLEILDLGHLSATRTTRGEVQSALQCAPARARR